ncbi:hypothetical protein IWX90DRAFT_435382 [Phyllosticta citrichinensis]|uniref:Secreted protein n=1 Tax=Phyllosticta citrichinensis TaxID=1130410 RepID=A0ABR1XQE4_9PEZI
MWERGGVVVVVVVVVVVICGQRVEEVWSGSVRARYLASAAAARHTTHDDNGPRQARARARKASAVGSRWLDDALGGVRVPGRRGSQTDDGRGSEDRGWLGEVRGEV